MVALSGWRGRGVRSVREGVDHPAFVDATPSSLYKGHRFPVEIISHCVWLYHRFPLSLRDVEQMMDQHGIVLDILVTSRRDAKAATRFFRKLLTGLESVPRVLVTDGSPRGFAL